MRASRGPQIKLILFWLASCGLVFLAYLKISSHLGSYSPLKWPHSRVGPLEILASVQSYGQLHVGTGIDGEAILVDGEPTSEVIGVHADSVVKVRVTEDQGMIQGECIYPDYVSQGRVRCFIADGGNLLFTSLTLSPANRRGAFKVRVPRNKELYLMVTAVESAHQAHGCWVNLK